MPLPRCTRMPSLTPVCLSQSRIEGADEIAEILVVHAINTLPFSTGKDPGVLAWIPQQRTLLLLLLVFLGTHRTTEWADELPFPESLVRHFSSRIQVELQQR